MACDLCGGSGKKVLYMGFPMRICDAHVGPSGQSMAFGWGFWGFVPCLFGYNGWFVAYSGAYLPALWRWLRSDE